MDIIGLTSILIGGGLFAFVQWLVDKVSDALGKKDKTQKAIEALSEKVDKIQHTIDEREAVLSRTHILRFNDELYNGVAHSKEYFDQTLEDITTYDKYCDDNPGFKNARTVMAEQHIKETYQKLLNEHKFL